jgi:hypothetical protein
MRTHKATNQVGGSGCGFGSTGAALASAEGAAAQRRLRQVRRKLGECETESTGRSCRVSTMLRTGQTLALGQSKHGERAEAARREHEFKLPRPPTVVRRGVREASILLCCLLHLSRGPPGSS